MTMLRHGLASATAGWNRFYTALELATVTDTIRRGGAIAAASATLMCRHPRLLVFPIVSTVTVLAILMRYVPFDMFVPLVPNGVLPIVNDGTWAMAAALFGTYLACVFITIFANAALMVGALAAMDGAPVSLLAGLGAAARRLPQILAWSVVSATVGFVGRSIGGAGKKALDRVAGGGNMDAPMWIAAIVAGGLFIVWTATYFVLPVLAVEGRGPIAALKRSNALLEARWSGKCAAAARFGLINFILLTLAILPFIIATDNIPLSRTATTELFTALIVYIAVLQLVLSPLGAVFVAAVYRYAVTGTAPAAFDAGLAETALCGQKF